VSAFAAAVAFSGLPVVTSHIGKAGSRPALPFPHVRDRRPGALAG